MLLQRFERKSFLHRIVTGNEKWIYFENPKRKKSWLSPGEVDPSTPRPNRFCRKTMLCVWWEQCGLVYFELLKPGETVNTDRYRQQIINLNHALIKKRPEWARRHGKVILQHDNAPSHTAYFFSLKMKNENFPAATVIIKIINNLRILLR